MLDLLSWSFCEKLNKDVIGAEKTACCLQVRIPE